jgi:hypothetical protein
MQIDAPTGLARSRCENHPDREAVAFCRECERTFCRECVTSHDDRVVCAACLSRMADDGDVKKRVRLNGLLMPIRALVGFVVVWVLLYAFGRILASASATFHKDGLWHDMPGEDA